MVSVSARLAKRRVKFIWPRQEKRRHQPYHWQPLADNDIRVLTLLPGRFRHDIRIRIDHIPFQETGPSDGARLSRRELQQTLPPGWTVHEGLDGRFIFIQWYDQEARITQSTSWTHPDPELDRSLYEAPAYEPPGPTNHAFEALSYVCGSQDDPTCAFVEGSTGTSSGMVLIGRNLEAALRHLRYEDRPRKLWVDAVCINQADDDEKSVE